MGKPVGIVLLVLGLVLGPCTHIASRFFSGTAIVEAPLTFETGGNGSSGARFAFSLPADALPAVVVIQASASHGPALQPANAPADIWKVRLIKGGQVIREQPIRLQSHMVEATSALVFKESIPLEDTQGGGDYVLDIALPSAPQLTLESARIEVRANIIPADLSWLAGGLVLIVAGLALILSA